MGLTYKTDFGYKLEFVGKSPCWELANTSNFWFRMDSQESFRNNMQNPDRRDKLISTGWTEDSITYDFNSYGFRADEFDGDGAIFLGCSFTQGIGIDWERSWCKLVADELQLKCWNLGIGGSSNDTAFRLGSYWIPKLQPKYVFYLPTLPYRMELISSDKFKPFLPMMIPEDKFRHFYDEWMSVLDNSMLNYEKNRRGIQSVCSENGIPCVIIEDSDRFHNTFSDYGRDLLHHGPSWNKMIADRMLSKIS